MGFKAVHTPGSTLLFILLTILCLFFLLFPALNPECLALLLLCIVCEYDLLLAPQALPGDSTDISQLFYRDLASLSIPSQSLGLKEET